MYVWSNPRSSSRSPAPVRRPLWCDKRSAIVAFAVTNGSLGRNRGCAWSPGPSRRWPCGPRPLPPPWRPVVWTPKPVERRCPRRPSRPACLPHAEALAYPTWSLDHRHSDSGDSRALHGALDYPVQLGHGVVDLRLVQERFTSVRCRKQGRRRRAEAPALLAGALEGALAGALGRCRRPAAAFPLCPRPDADQLQQRTAVRRQRLIASRKIPCGS